jgi:hypothetical protein
MDEKTTLLLLVPIILVELALKIWALVDLVRRPRTRGPKAAWAVAIVCVSLFGWAAYFLFGRAEDGA